METFINKLIDGLTDFGMKLVAALVIIVIGFKLIKFVVSRMQNGKVFNKMEKTYKSFISSIITVLLKSIVVIIAVSVLGIPMTSIITVVGSFGLALGLALQGGLSNIAGGVMIMIFKPFKVGDYIDTHTDSGTVKSINIFNTVLVTIDNRTVVLPNGGLSNSVIVNYTALKERRIDLDVSVSYESDIDKVKKVLNNICEKNKYRLDSKEYFVALKEHSDSSLIFTVRVWVLTENYWTARFELLESIKKEFDKNKISIPYPQLDVHMSK